MRICVVSESHPLAYMGGAEYQTGLLTDLLCRRPDVSLTFLARHVPSPEVQQTLPYAVRCIGRSAGIRRRAVFFDAPELWRALTEIRPDVIYQQAKQSYTLVCAHYARRHNIPFFYQVASDADLDHRWIMLHVSANTPFEVVESLAGDCGIRRASHVAVQTQRQAEALRSRFGRAPAALVHNFQPIPEALPVKPDGPLKILWVANFKDVKRPALFMDLAESFAGNPNLQFVMVGRPSRLRRFAATMARASRIPNLTYLGAQPVERVCELMSEAAIHVNTSSFEGFPNTFIQAWAYGAVVTSVAVDPDQCMERERIGFCAGSMENLHALIARLAVSPEERRETALRGFEFARTHHSLAEGERFAELIVSTARNNHGGLAKMAPAY